MADDSIEPSVYGGSAGSSIRVGLSDDALGFGRGLEGVVREIRKGPEGLLDRADRFYQLKQIFLPVHSAKQDAKAMAIRAEALREVAAILGASSPEGIAATRMMIAEYSRRYENIDATIAQAMPMIGQAAAPEGIEDDWLGYAFDYIGGVGEATVQELWARLLAQEANRPGLISKRAVTKLALLDRRSAYHLRNVLTNAITLYVPTPDEGPNSGMPLYKIGRFALPLLVEMLGWSGPKPGDDLVRRLDAGRDGPTSHGRQRVRWLVEEGFVREVAHEKLRDGYLNPRFWEACGWKQSERPLAIRVGLGQIYASDAGHFSELLRRYANGGATTEILQLTDLSEALLDPRITHSEPIAETNDADSPRSERSVEGFLKTELGLQATPAHRGIAENPGFLGHGHQSDQDGLEFFYHEY